MHTQYQRVRFLVDGCLFLLEFSASFTHSWHNYHVSGCFAVRLGCSPSCLCDHHASPGPSRTSVRSLSRRGLGDTPAGNTGLQASRDTRPAPGSTSLGEALRVDASFPSPSPDTSPNPQPVLRSCSFHRLGSGALASQCCQRCGTGKPSYGSR